jgi:hypothetical protein
MKKLIAALVIALALPLSASAKNGGVVITFGQAPGALAAQAPGPASFGNTVYFAVSQPAASVRVDCWLGGFLGPLVYSQTQAANSGFQLGPTATWTGGFADCMATALGSNGHAIAQMSFSVTG